ncbi:MAG TPA: DUF3078 domain-containing protein [Flavobacteriales bacterium]|nr:DUF3078 domain-containing protein [Flavobacteriales bacterium]
MKDCCHIPIVLVFLVLSGHAGYGQNKEKGKELTIHVKDTVDGWDKGCIVTSNLSQTSLWNWAAGGQSSVAITGLLSAYATETTGGGLWENNFDLAYGVLKQGNTKAWWKTDDKIDLTSKYGKKASGKWYYAALLNFKTQLAPGYNYPDDSTKISDLLAPGYVIVALGVENKPEKEFGLYVAPLTLKLSMVNDQELADAGAFGVEKAIYDETTGAKISGGKKTRSELGCYARVFYARDVMENVTLKTELDLFSNYVDEPENIDVNWEVLLNMKVNKYITASISTQLVYDNDIEIGIDSTGDGVIDSSGPRTQFKEVIAVGVSYKL